MEDNKNKVCVFDPKEVFLIFLFMVAIAVTAFTLGVNFGKKLSLKQDGYTPSDVDKINLKSQEEEYADTISDNAADMGDEAVQKSQREVIDDSQATLEKEIERLSKEDVSVTPARPSLPADAMMEETPVVKDDIYSVKSEVSGKFTIQLASFSTRDEAQNFADGFIANGYDAVINEVIIPTKGTWFRVSIGVFDNINDAKAYLEQEKNFFQNKDYLIKQFK